MTVILGFDITTQFPYTPFINRAFALFLLTCGAANASVGWETSG
jgi:hypothetical protein